MVGDAIKGILEAEAQAARILSDAEASVRKIEKKSQTDIENLKVTAAKLLHEKIKVMSDAHDLENKAQVAEVKVDKAKIEVAKEYIILSLLGGER